MLKMTGLSDKPAPRRNDGNKSAYSRNDNGKPASRRNNDNGEVDGFSNDSVEHAKKSEKLKDQKMSKSQKLAKSKKQSKNRNSPNFDATEVGSSFSTPKARTAFTKALIFWHLDLECHIWIEIDASGYAIGDLLRQLASGTRPDRLVIKTNLGQWHPIAFFSRKIIPAKT